MNKLALAGFLVVGGSAAVALSAGRMETPPAPPAGCRLQLNFASSVPDEYYVLSGPAESYARYPVNDELRRALQNYSGRVSSSADVKTVGLFVHLESVITNYDQLGAGLFLPRPRMAGVGGWGRVRHLDWDDGPSIPEKVTKSVVLMLDSRIDVSGRAPQTRSFHASATQVVDRDHWDAWAYSYDDVIRESVHNAVLEVDRFLRESLK